MFVKVFVAVRYVVLCCAALRYIALHCVTLRYIVLHCVGFLPNQIARYYFIFF